MVILPPTCVPAPRPFFLHGWDFLAFVEAGDESAVAIRGVAAWEGPTIIYSQYHIEPEELEDPAFARWWLPTAMFHIARTVLSESISSRDGFGCYFSSEWDAYRNAVCRHMTMNWEGILSATHSEGTEFMAESATHSLFLESGLHRRLKVSAPVLIK